MRSGLYTVRCPFQSWFSLPHCYMNSKWSPEMFAETSYLQRMYPSSNVCWHSWRFTTGLHVHDSACCSSFRPRFTAVLNHLQSSSSFWWYWPNQWRGSEKKWFLWSTDFKVNRQWLSSNSLEGTFVKNRFSNWNPWIQLTQTVILKCTNFSTRSRWYL